MARSINRTITDILVGRGEAIERFERSLERQVTFELIDLEAKLRGLIEESSPGGARAVHHRQARLDKMLGRANELITESYGRMRQMSTEASIGAGVLEAESIQESLNDAIGARLFTRRANKSDLTNVYLEGARVHTLWTRQKNRLLDRFSDEMTRGTLRREDNRVLIERLIGTVRNQVGGIMRQPYKGAVGVLQSSLAGYVNKARMETWRANADVLKAFRWDSTLDDRTSAICIRRDGALWDPVTLEPLPESPIQDPFPEGEPPAHWHCRGLWGVVLRAAHEMPARVRKALEGLSSTKLAALDGAIPETSRRRDWFSRLSKKRQLSHLGPTRFALYEAGKLPVRELASPEGKVRNLDELRDALNLTAADVEVVR